MINNFTCYDEGRMMGEADDLVDELEERLTEEELAEDEALAQMFEYLKTLDDKLVYCLHHPMGAWSVSVLNKEDTKVF